jgi:abequosyltransferase
MTLISVCIPSYNRAEVLSELLDSILTQDFCDYEIVIAEDNSPQRSDIRAIASHYSQCHRGRIRYFENSINYGYDGNIRKLVELANGRYVLFMGNDDLLAPNALRSIAEAVHIYPNIGVVLRSYASFIEAPSKPVQIFRYFDEDKYFPSGPGSLVTFFRRCVFISGLVVRRSSALAYASDKFDGTLLYQQYLVGNILKRESGIYLHCILAYHRLGGVPDFGINAAEQGRFVPQRQTPESSVHFVKGMLSIGFSLNDSDNMNIGRMILQDIGNYSYPILSIQAGCSRPTFTWYTWQLLMLGFWRVPLFYIYAIGLLLIGRSSCDFLVRQIKRMLGRAPRLGTVYSGTSYRTWKG